MIVSEKEKFRFQLLVLNDVVGYNGVILVYDEFAGLGVNLMGSAAVYNLLDFNFPSGLTQSLRERNMAQMEDYMKFEILIDSCARLAEKIFRVFKPEDLKVAYPEIADAPNLIYQKFLTKKEIVDLDERMIQSWGTDNNLTLNDASREEIQNARDKHFGDLDEFILDRTKNFLQATNLFIKTISNG